ncbi:hypothetical protein DSO57_1014026 [Entomophthora muscae]|uniref:Uncharacterized protein n=1 Tax=Entomophthora muscae TaxID=34485 RepID=A0ACC2T5Y5_9FUNG|nr:hypothetical protein DSO57_1014026 [Entomophthora muscae]
MSSGNPPKPNHKAPTFRRARAETLPSRTGGTPENAASNSSLNSGLSSNTSSPFRSRLSSFTLGVPEASFSKLSWEDPLGSLPEATSESKNSSIFSHYEVAAAKTLDFLGLNDDSSPLSPRIVQEPVEVKSLTALPRSSHSDCNPFTSINATASLGNLSDSDSDNTVHSPHSRASISSESHLNEIESLCLRIENLGVDVTLSKLTNEVSQYGDVESVQLLKKEGAGIVTFSSFEEAKAARAALNDKKFFDSQLKVKFYKEAGDGESSKGHSRQTSKSDLTGAPEQGKSSSPDATSNVYNKTKEYYNRQAENFKLAAAEIAARGSQKHELLMSFDYAVTLPPIPNPNFKRKVEPTRLRELRKQLETDPSREVITATFNESRDCWVDLCSDYIGNIIIQKLIEYGSEQQKTALILSVAPYMAAIGIHKNGTWAIQKMIECATTEDQIAPIAAALKPFTPALLLDQFGNYVVQCCLKFEYPYNQFIFDSIYARCSEIAQGRYGARAIRTCLDSQYTVPAQKDLVSEALMRNAYPLSTNANGSLLLNWILDSQHTEHYMGIVINLNSHLAQLCCHKLASSIIVRLINQQQDMQAREFLVYRLFFQNSPGPVLNEILADHAQGNQFVQKVLNSPYLGEELKAAIQVAVNSCASVDSQQLLSYRRLLFEELPAYGGLSQQMVDSSFTPFVAPPVPEMSGPWPWGWGAHSAGGTPYYGAHSGQSSHGSYFAPTPAPASYQPNFNGSDSRARQTPSPHVALNTN